MATKTEKVIFICIHNSGRSQMAEAFFNRMVQGKAKAVSAGSQPAEKVNPIVIEAMKEVGIDIGRNKPKLLTPDMLDGIDLAITMGCEDACPYTTAETRDWELEDPKDKNIEQVRKIRNEIETRVRNLVKEVVSNDLRDINT